MKLLLKNAVLLMAVCILAGCNVDFNFRGGKGIKGSGISATETREVESFDSVSHIGFGILNLSQGEEMSVQITADDNLLEVIEATVKNGVLTISPTESIRPKSKLEVNIVCPEFKVIKAAGAVTVNVDNLSGDSIEFDLSGAGNVEGTGNVSELAVSIAGAGSAKLEEFEALKTKVTISGAGSATVCAKESINAVINGAGSIKVLGNPADINKSVNGVGSIKIVE